MRSRREVVALALAGLAMPSITALQAQSVRSPFKMKPGQFTWNPERAPGGFVTIVVSLPEQLVHVYRNGVEIGVSSCSTGRPGHGTPTGVFTILEKQREHVSSIYKGAQMPNMERLTWGGIALHAGNLPGYPASHGCVRLPTKFSALLYGVTHVGSIVIIADERTQPREVAHPGPLLAEAAEVEARAIAGGAATRRPHDPWEPEVHYPITSVLISRRDGMAYVRQDRDIVGEYPVGIARPDHPIGTHTYSLIGPAADGAGLSWLAFGIGKSRKDAHIVRWQADEAMKRVLFRDKSRALAIARSFHTGTTLLITDSHAPNSTRETPNDFAVMSSDAGV